MCSTPSITGCGSNSSFSTDDVHNHLPYAKRGDLIVCEKAHSVPQLLRGEFTLSFGANANCTSPPILTRRGSGGAHRPAWCDPAFHRGSYITPEPASPAPLLPRGLTGLPALSGQRCTRALRRRYDNMRRVLASLTEATKLDALLLDSSGNTTDSCAARSQQRRHQLRLRPCR